MIKVRLIFKHYSLFQIYGKHESQKFQRVAGLIKLQQSD